MIRAPFIGLFIFTLLHATGQDNLQEVIDFAMAASEVQELEQMGGKYELFIGDQQLLSNGMLQTIWFLYKKKKAKATEVLTLSHNGRIAYMDIYERAYNFESETDYWSVEIQQSRHDSVLLPIPPKPHHLMRNPYPARFGTACSVVGPPLNKVSSYWSCLIPTTWNRWNAGCADCTR